jgi:CheY-like chemotaxis protein
MTSASSDKKMVPILIADDDHDDCELIRDAFYESRLLNQLIFVHDGEDLLRYLNREGKFADEAKYPWPGLILLDLNMPRKDGREALREIKNNPTFEKIPIVVLTTSRAEEDVYRTYQMGVSDFVTKPVTFEALVQIIQDLKKFWVQIVHAEDPLKGQND